jgi:hypothetical protein
MEQQNKETKADKIRALTAQGMKPRDIAATVGSTLQAVYDVQYRDRIKARVAKKKLASVSVSPRISPVTGKPVRKYKKRKAKKSLAERGAELKRMAEERRAERAVPTPPKVQYIEIEVPQPHYNLTWGQRFKALFTGRV